MEEQGNRISVRVFGLERSGTNLMEWVVRNHFNPDYQRIMIKGTHPSMRYYKHPQSLKHTLPTLDYSEKIIVVYKPYEQWVESWERYYKRGAGYRLGGDHGCSKYVHDMYLKIANHYKEEGKAYVIDYNEFIADYEGKVKEIGEFLEVKDIKVKPKPSKWMGTNMKPNV